MIKQSRPNSLYLIILFIAFIFPAAVSASDAETAWLKSWHAGTVVSDADVRKVGVDRCFVNEEIGDKVFNRMWLKSWKRNCTMKRSQLCYLKMLHRNAKGQTQLGEMVVNKAIAGKVLRIFRKLYDAGYRIERMVLIDNYNADDQASMRANNTSCFNFRFMTGSRTRVSRHGQGLAIDINTLYNPYVRKNRNGTWTVEPKEGRSYAFNRDKRKDIPYKIDRNDLAYKLFIEAGFTWGGAWRHSKDYQHFEISIR